MKIDVTSVNGSNVLYGNLGGLMVILPFLCCQNYHKQTHFLLP